MSDLSIFKLDSQTITIKDTTARQTAESAKTLATAAATAGNAVREQITELKNDLNELQDGVVYTDDIVSLEIVTDTKSLKNDGTLVAAGGYSIHAEVGTYDVVQFTAKNFMTNSASPYPVTAFTNASGSIIKMTEAGTYTNNKTYTEEVPSGAKYFYINTWSINGSISGISRTYNIPDTIEYYINTDFYELVWTNRIYFWGVGTRSGSTTRIGLENMLQARTNITISAADGYDITILVFTSSTEGTANEKRFSNWVKKAIVYSGEYFLINVRKTDDSAIVVSEGYNSVLISQEDVSNGTVMGSDLIKRKVLTENIGKIKYFQSFCVYDGNYFSTNGDNIAKQDSSLAEISTTALSVGHGNGFQLGSSNIAYISGWSDQKIYAINLDTITLDSTITLPTTGYTTAVVDDLNNIAYIFQRDSYPDTETNYTFIAYNYANSTVLYSKLMPNKFGAMQAADFYNGKIIVAYGTGTSDTPSGVFVCDTNGCILAEYFLDVLQSLEPEGVCFNRDTGTFMVSDVNRNIHKVTAS